MTGGDAVVYKIPCQDLKSLAAHPHQEFQGVPPAAQGALHWVQNWYLTWNTDLSINKCNENCPRKTKAVVR